jgi:indole-3-glycerol phosphate synthase/phosphoribosylanthranilate isomerase
MASRQPFRSLGSRLDDIVERKYRDVARQLDGISLDALRSWTVPTKRSLRAALAEPGARFICEVKRASPSNGDLMKDVDAKAQALLYKGAADAISVVTDGPFFKGSLDDLAQVRAVYDGPILAKDFMIDVRQVTEARMHGADAILVMMSVLTKQEARPIIAEATRLGMDVLVEVHDEEELEDALHLNATLIGINNRNLKTFGVNLGVTERLASRVPADRILVSESGISDRSDVERLASHVDAFLVGTALMRAERPALRARGLAFGRVKVCGLTTIEDAITAADAGASYAGFVFVAESPRAVTISAAEPIAATMRERGILTAGVFRDMRPVEIAKIATSIGLNVIQLHGSEDEASIKRLRDLLSADTEIWAASPVGRDVPPPRDGADRTLYDSLVHGCSGGTGRAFDWGKLDRRLLKSAVLAGGLNQSNARKAVRTDAWALDVGSGVERCPGRKDRARLTQFFDALRPLTPREFSRCNSSTARGQSRDAS